MDLAEWLRNLALEQYAAVFNENHVAAEDLPFLTADDLKEIGITAVGHRRRLLAAIAALQDKPAGNRSRRDSGRNSLTGAERRQITVLFCDIVGSTPLSRGLDPEDLREVLTEYQASVGAAVAAQQGYVARFVGDGVLAYFGWPNADEAHAESAVRAGLAIVEAVGPQRLSVRVGIATGLVITGDLVGVGSAQTVTAVGETPNLAARLQSMAHPDTVVVSEATRSLLGKMFDLEDLGALKVKGFDKPLRAWRALGDTGAASRSEALYSGAVTPLIGRDEELNLLAHRWRQSSSGEGRVVLLSGEAGIGKSRLLAALEQRLVGERRTSLRYFCSPHHTDSPLHPVISRMEREAGFLRSDSPSDRLTKLEAVLAPSEPTAAEMALLAAMLSVPSDGRYHPLDLSPQQRKTRTSAALLRRLSNLALREPVLMLFEDAHWADPTSLELLDAVIEKVPSLPILLIISYRPEFAAHWFDLPGVSLMALSRLDRRDSARLAAQVVKHQVLSSRLVDQIVLQSDGVPLFIEELTKAVLEVTDTGSQGMAISIPDTLQATLMARLDRLPSAKTIAQVGSVVGREFSHVLLAAAAGMPDEQLMDGLDELSGSGLLFRRGTAPDAVYTFKHALVRDVVYASLPRQPRQHLHQMIGEALRDQFPERSESEPELIAHHFEQAGLGELAVDWWSKAGDLALQRFAMVEAVAHLERALELAEQLEDSQERRLFRARLQISYGNALRVVRGYAAPETKAAFAIARSLAMPLPQAPERFSAEYGLWSASFLSGDLSSMRELADAFLHNTEGRPASPETVVAHRLDGMTRWFIGNFHDAQSQLERAIDCYDSERDMPMAIRFGQDLVVPAMIYSAISLWAIGSETAAARFDESVAHALRTEHVPTIAYTHLHGGFFEMLRRDRARSAVHMHAYLGLAREYIMPTWLAYGAFHEGWLRWYSGDHERGADQMRNGLRLMQEQGISTFRPLFGVLLAETQAAAGLHDLALASVHCELSRISQTGERWFLAEAERALGEILLASRRDPKGAEAAFLRAIDVARAQSARQFERSAARSLARLRAEQGGSLEPLGPLSILARIKSTNSAALGRQDT